MIALVTGGGRGIGRAIAARLAGDGAAVAIVARTESEVREAAEEIGAMPLVADVTDRAAVDALVARVEDELGPIDLLVNNAGVLGPRGELWETDPDEWWRVVDVNLRGTLLPTHAVLPSMIARGSGRIVNVASEAGAGGTAPGLAYGVSKAAVIRLTEQLAPSLEANGVLVFAISPGGVRTRMTEPIAALFGGEWAPPERAAALVARIAGGEADALAGRYLHAVYDDLDELLARAEEISRDELYVLRVRK